MGLKCTEPLLLPPATCSLHRQLSRLLGWRRLGASTNMLRKVRREKLWLDPSW